MGKKKSKNKKKQWVFKKKRKDVAAMSDAIRTMWNAQHRSVNR